jgi:hypothetical protein
MSLGTAPPKLVCRSGLVGLVLSIMGCYRANLGISALPVLP